MRMAAAVELDKWFCLQEKLHNWSHSLYRKAINTDAYVHASQCGISEEEYTQPNILMS